MENKPLTGYPSIDKPWLKYYSEEAINAPLPECTIYEYLYENNKDHLDDIALNYFDRKITYGELFENIEKTAKAFSAMGVKEGDIVTVCSVTTPEIIYAFYGLNRIGAISNMVDPRTSTEGIKHYIEEVQSKLVVTIDVALPKIEKSIIGTKVEKIITVSPLNSVPQPKKAIATFASMLKGGKVKLSANCIDWNDFYNTTAEPKYVEYKKDTCCVIVHTGGTTGTPKGVMLSNDNLNCASQQMKFSNAKIGRGDVFLNIMPPFIAYGIVLGMHAPLTLGWHTVIIPQFKTEEFERLLKKYRPNGIMGIPTYWNKLMDSKSASKLDMSYLKCILLGGDKTSATYEEKLNSFLQAHNSPASISKGYSMTEASACATFATGKSNKHNSAGIPLVNTELAICDNNNLEVRFFEKGEICFHSPTVMMGYYNNDHETSNVLKKHSDEKTWLHTGDIGYLDDEGFVYVIDRIKRVIIRFDGFKVFPTQIETTVSKSKLIESCCAIGKLAKEHSQGELPVVFAVLSNGTDKTTAQAELARLCKSELPEYAQPVDFIFIDKLPLTPIGKVDYRKLEQMASGI